MRSSDRIRAAVTGVALWLVAAPAQADEETGFSLERLAVAPPGAGWLTLDDLAAAGPLRGAASLALGHARAPLRIAGTDVVRNQAFASVTAGASMGRFRAWAELSKPLWIEGAGGTAGSTKLAAPSLDAANVPDGFSDLRFGVGARLLGEASDPVRAGVALELYVPAGDPSDYVTDGDYRATARVAIAGDRRWLTWAAHFGAHVRDRDLGDGPSVPRGSELVFAAGAGVKLGDGRVGRLVLGPEVFGATAMRAAFVRDATALEALGTARLGAPLGDGRWWAIRVGVGAGLVAHFGAPAFRSVLAVEIGGVAGNGAP